jgi:hypothetical protein
VYSQELVWLDILRVVYITQNISVIDSNQIDRTGMTVDQITSISVPTRMSQIIK